MWDRRLCRDCRRSALSAPTRYRPRLPTIYNHGRAPSTIVAQARAFDGSTSFIPLSCRRPLTRKAMRLAAFDPNLHPHIRLLRRHPCRLS